MKRLYRSRQDAQLIGLCAGLGQYFGVDPTVVRLFWVVATLLTGVVPGVLAYLAGWLIVPEEPQEVHATTPSPQAQQS